MSLIETHVVDVIERERLSESRDAYRIAAIYLYNFVKNNVAIVGHEEIKAWHIAKNYYEQAKKTG
jgi:ssDNA-binding replication factor A large subunit